MPVWLSQAFKILMALPSIWGALMQIWKFITNAFDDPKDFSKQTRDLFASLNGSLKTHNTREQKTKIKKVAASGISDLITKL